MPSKPIQGSDTASSYFSWLSSRSVINSSSKVLFVSTIALRLLPSRPRRTFVSGDLLYQCSKEREVPGSDVCIEPMEPSSSANSDCRSKKSSMGRSSMRKEIALPG